MYKLVEPYRAYLYLPFLKSFNNDLEILLSKFKLENLNFFEVSNYIAEVLDQIHLPDFVFMFDEWLELQDNSPENRYTLFFKKQNKKWRNDLRYNNKYISNLSESICHSTLKNIETFLSRLTLEYNIINDFFCCPPLTAKGELSIAGGDRHNNGQQPIILNLDGFKIIYKPRNSGAENLLNNICEIIGEEPICPKTLCMESHIWQEFIKNRGLSSLDEAHEVYRKYGNILALADILNINDCHFENFIVDKNKVWFIDPETFLQYYFDDNPSFERSIYQSGLLQSPNVFVSGIGHTSAITAISNIFKSFTYPHAINDGSENIQVKYERGFIKNTQNYPHYEGKPVTAKKYYKDIINGYVTYFNRLKENKNRIITFISSIKQLIHPRYLIRTTAYYLLVINKIIHPANSRCMPQKLNSLINEYLHYKNSKSLFTPLIPYEENCLINYDVPFFYFSVDALSLFDGTGKEYHNFFPCSPLKQLEKKF